MRPRLTITEGNDELIWQIKHLRFSEWRGNVTDKDPPEKPRFSPHLSVRVCPDNWRVVVPPSAII